jgi:hypothetical protein
VNNKTARLPQSAVPVIHFWSTPDGAKIQDPDDVLNVNFGDDKGTKMVWNKPNGR